MITFALLWAVLFAALLGWANMQGHHLLTIRSRRARQQLHDPGRDLLPAERQALTREFHLALPEGAMVYRQTGSIRLVGWRTPQFLLDDLLIGLPEPLHGCANYGFDNTLELILNPHQGAPHAFALSLNGVSLLCDCQARAAGISRPVSTVLPSSPLRPRTEFVSAIDDPH